jgi:anthranilate phosphoribosyltransferase
MFFSWHMVCSSFAKRTGGTRVNIANHLGRLIGGDAGSRELTEPEARQLAGMILDGGVPDLELGALLVALRSRPLALEEWIGFHQALAERVHRLKAPEAGVRPLVMGSQSGPLDEPNLLPLLALLLARFGVPVLIHGNLHGDGRVLCAHVFRALDILPCATLAQAQKALDGERLAFVPTGLLAPGLAGLLALRARLGAGNFAHALARLLDPIPGESCRVVGVAAARLEDTRELLRACRADALLLAETEGDAFANPRRRPRIEYLRDGESRVLFEAEAGAQRALPGLPRGGDAAATAAWTRQALSGEVPLPMPIVNQLACCLYAGGYTDDMNQAKAIVAVKSVSAA